MFFAASGLLVGFQWQSPRLEAYLDYYVWGRNFLAVTAFVLVLADAYQSSIWQALLCLLLPPFTVVHAMTRLTSYVQRGLFFAVLAALVVEVFLLPSESVVLGIQQGIEGFIAGIDQLITRAGG